MGSPDLLERLRQHKLLSTVPEYELNWLVEHGEFRQILKGGFYSRKGERADHLTIVLTGNIAIYVDRGLGPRRVTEWKAGEISGWMPYSRIKEIPGDVIALEETDTLLVHRGYGPDMIRECPTLTEALVHVMVERARTFKVSEQQDEKMLSLGRMAAGLAHELNNPTTAIRRTAQRLQSYLDDAETSARAMAAGSLTPTQVAALDAARRVCGTSVTGLSPLDRADREDALTDWLDDHGADSDLAGVLLETGATPESLDALGGAFEGESFNSAIKWIAASCAARALTKEIETASSRVHDLVSAFKRSSYMDQAQVPEAMDIALGLRDTVRLMEPKARDKSVSMILSLEPGLPGVIAIGSHLNQVWTNLIDNALDAAPPGTEVQVSARAERGAIIVRVIDHGSGIPESIREKIFDQFFTTKEQGKGTGLGLEIVRRLVHQSQGDIEFDSEPGHTEFRIMLKLAPTQAPQVSSRS